MSGPEQGSNYKLVYVAVMLTAALLWWLNPFAFLSNACKSPFASPRERAVALDLTGDKAGAVASYSTYLRDNPADIQAVFSRGIDYVQLRQPDAAIADLTNVLQQEPQEYGARAWRGDAYLLQGNYDSAIDDYTQWIEHTSEPSTAILYSRGLAYLKVGRFDAAKADFLQALALRPGLSENEYLERARDCATLNSHDGDCGSLPLDPYPTLTHLIDLGARQLSGC
jgi:tetratricopeptide (TPR) repeat protein